MSNEVDISTTAKNLAIAISAVAVACPLCLLILSVKHTVDRLPQQIDWNVAQVLQEVHGIHTDVITQVSAGRTDITRIVSAQAEAAQAKVDRAISIVDDRSKAAIETVNATVISANMQVGGFQQTAKVELDEANRTLARFADQTQPLLSESTATVKDLHDSWDDNYYDLKAITSSATVAVAGVGRSADEVAKAMPVISRSSASIANNVAREVDEATRPKRWWQKILGPVYTVGRLVAAFL